MEKIELEGSRVIARVDINAPIEDGTVTGTARLDAAASSIKALVEEGAGVVMLGHQGRPGRPDFTSLEQHAGLLEDRVGQDVTFTPHVDDKEAVDAVKRVEPGEILLLDNVRGAEGEIENLNPEEHAERSWVQRLAGEADAFVLDGFSVAHRSHASIVGFPRLVPSAAGPLLKQELDALERVESDEQDRRVLVLGGTKIRDALDVIEHHLDDDRADLILTGGIVGEAFLHARGHKLGDATVAVMDKFEAFDAMNQVERLLEEHGPRIATPEDLAYEADGKREEILLDELPVDSPVLDIGPESALAYAQEIHDADTVVVNGPVGAYERRGFAAGTDRLLESCATSTGFTLIGGGHTVTALERAGWRTDDFSHVSLAGGALVRYLSGDPLPGLESLAESARRFALETPPV